jgi:hypothetical protein
MLEVTIIIEAVKRVDSWFDVFRKYFKPNDDICRATLKSLYTALSETKSYLYTLNPDRVKRRNDPKLNGRKAGKDIEVRLSRLWIESSLKLRNIDHSLADDWILKGEFWSNPDHWNEGEVLDIRNKVNKVLKGVRKLL